MFKFGFSSDNVGDETHDLSDEESSIEWFESKEVLPEKVIFWDNVKVNSIQCDELIINYVSNEDVVEALKSNTEDVNNSLLNAEKNDSDLITAVYEGGLKIWECTFDLLNFINKQAINFSNKRVLDLGCGAGIVGVFSCMKGATTVFQDYNLEVIKSVTIPNVSLNNIDYDKCAFYCGDWKSFLDLQQKRLCENEKFDYIFTSETIYNIQNYRKILNIFKQLLKNTGIMYP